MKLTQNSRRAPGINDQGEIELQRSTTDRVELCQALAGEDGDGGDGGDGTSPTKSGTWFGRGTNPDFSVYAVCFNLSGDLSKLTSTDTLCNNVYQKCDIEFSYTPDVPIKNKAFSVQNFERYPGDEKWSFEGTFDGNTATGTATRHANNCVGKWTASKQ
jgi:hypothetical protein